MRYDAILLDADGTVYDFHSAERAALDHITRVLGFRDPKATEVYFRVNEACWADYEKKKITQEQLRIRLFREWIEHYGLNADPAMAADAFLRKLSTQGQLLPGAGDAVRRIAARVPVAIVTNGFSEVQRGRFMRSEIRDCVKALVVSGDLGFAKPDPRMIWEAAAKLGVDPGRTLMVGDGLFSDILGAQNAGVDACWYNPDGAKCTLDRQPQYQIRSLSEITDRIL